jgi:hypothetical protein
MFQAICGVLRRDLVLPASFWQVSGELLETEVSVWLQVYISFGFSNRSVQCFLGQKKKKNYVYDLVRKTEKGLVIYVHDLNQMSVASCRCNEGKKKKKKKKKRPSCPYYFQSIVGSFSLAHKWSHLSFGI